MTAITVRRPAWPRAAAADRPRWAGIGLGALLAGTALLYLIGLSRNGWANDFYAAAVQAGTKSWKAFFFGSFDASSFITVDKTPASLWVMELSARLFGLNYWSVLVPQALEGVASVALLYATVRRWFGPGAGLLAGAALALTPVAALMFRFNNPDALLVLLMTAAAYGTARAIESGRTRWLLLAGGLLGLGFLTKMAQAFLVVPGFGLAYLMAGPRRLLTRVWQLLAALAALIVGAGWWVAAVMLTPAASRPYVGGSTNDSILQLALGYNGFGRLDGNETGSVGGGGGRGSAFGGSAGLQRLFAAEMGGQISWLLPAALLAIVVLGGLAWRSNRGLVRDGTAVVPAVWAVSGRPGGPGSLSGQGGDDQPAGGQLARLRSDPRAASVLLWGSWLVVTGLVFSYMAGIIHPYYTVALAPPIAALVGIGAVALWRERATWAGRALLAAGVAVTVCWSYLLLDRSPDWYPALRWAVLIVGLVSAAVLLLGPLAGAQRPGGRVAATRVAGVAAAGAIAAALAGPAAYSIDTAATSHTGALPTAGPAVTSSFGGPGGGGFGGGRFGGTGRAGGPAGTGTGGAGTGGAGTGGGTGTGRNFGTGHAPGGFPGSGGTGRSGTGAGTGRLPGTGTRTGTGGGPGTGAGGFPGRSGAGGPGGLSGSTQVSKALASLLEKNASAYSWVAATVGSESAAPLQLATGQPVMSIGGFNGTDPTPTLARFKTLVAEHKIHYFVGENADSFGGGSGDAAAITKWVAAHFKAQTVGGETVYNLAGSG